MSTLMDRRRAMMMSAGSSIDWKEQLIGMHNKTLVDAIVPSGVTKIPDNIFSSQPNMVSVVIPSGVTSIGNSAFNVCRKLKDITLPEGVVSIGQYCFMQDVALKSFVVPSTVTSLSNHVFNGCTGLTELIFLPTTPPTLGTVNPLGQTTYTFPIYVPDASLNDYKTAAVWVDYASRIFPMSDRPTT